MILTGRSCSAALIVAVAAAVAAAGTVEPDGDPLCPPATDRRTVVVMDGVEIRAPDSAAETETAIAGLASTDRDERQRGALSLALAGDLEAFDRLLELRDIPGLSTYGRFYVNSDGSACVADEIESSVIAGIADSELRPALTAFFERSLYRRRELFDRLIRVGLDDGPPQSFDRVVMALLATRLDGIEDEVLAQAISYLEHDTPVRKRVLPGVHRRWVAFFAERSWNPAIPYMEDLLLAEGYDETLDSFVAEFSQTRSRVYRALDGLSSPEVGAVFVRQLGRVVDRCQPDLVNYELAAFGSFAVRHAATDERRRQVAGSLATLLGVGPAAESDRAPGAVDYRIHTTIVGLLAELATADAAAVLVRDLRRLSELGDASLADPQIVSTLEALRALPASTQLDVPRFLAAAAGLADGYRLHSVPEILDAHPDPAAHAFYLDQLQWVLAGGADATSPVIVDRGRLVDLVLERLLAYEELDQLAATRDALDRFYLDGGLDERRYVAAAGRVNDLLGDESATYRELQERQRLAREAEIQKRIDEEAADWRTVVDRNTSPDGVRANLQKLGERGDAARIAASWLVIAGQVTPGPANDMLADPEVSLEAKLPLLQILGEIGDPRSVGPVIAFVRANADNRALLGAGLQALALMPTSAETFGLCVELLDEGSSTTMKQQALVALAAVRDPRAQELARLYSAADVEPEVRVAGLLLAARLGDSEVAPAILGLLDATEDRPHRDVLVRALAELSTQESLDKIAASRPGLSDTRSFADARELVAFRHAEGESRLELARRLIERGHPWDRREAVGYLVEGRHTEVLFSYLQLFPHSGQPLLKSVIYSPGAVPVYAQILRMGYRVEETPEGLELIRDE